MKQMRSIAVLIMLLGLVTLACDALSGGEEPTAAPVATVETATEESSEEETAETEAPTAVAETAVPTAEPSPEPTEEADAPPESEAEESTTGIEELELRAITEGNLEFDSYRFQIMMSFSDTDADGNELRQSIDGDMSFTTDPEATAVNMRLEGFEGEMEGFEQFSMVQMEGTTYMSLPGFGCISSQATEDELENPFAELMAPDTILGDLEGARRVGEETINGIATVHYTFDETALEEESGEVERAQGDLYVAQDGGYLVRLVIDAEGQMDFFDQDTVGTGTMRMEFNLTDVNEPIEIAPPADCGSEGGAASSDLPMLEDAYDVSSFAGFVSYLTNTSFEDTVAFYEEALAAEGWQKDEDESLLVSGSAILSYTRDGETLNLTVGEDSESDATFVLIITETEGE
jgi:hypothetical protein